MSDKRVLIGLCGEMQSGKDSVYKAMVELGYQPYRIAFGDFLKRELAKALGTNVDFINQHKSQFRLGLQWFGTDYRRHFYGQDYWVKQATYELNMARAPVVVFTDVRFRNEVHFIRKHGGYIWLVKRPKGIWACIKSKFQWKHQSECLKVDPDVLIYNDGTLADLKNKVALAWDATIG